MAIDLERARGAASEAPEPPFTICFVLLPVGAALAFVALFFLLDALGLDPGPSRTACYVVALGGPPALSLALSLRRRQPHWTMIALVAGSFALAALAVTVVAAILWLVTVLFYGPLPVPLGLAVA